jgi:hypothetical protein
MEILGQYTSGSDAVTHALRLVVSYILRASDAASKVELAEKYTPQVLSRKTVRKSSDAVIVFDIDDTLLFDVKVTKQRKQSVIPHQVVVDLLHRLRQLGADIHLVTARLNEPSCFRETEEELKLLGISYNTLTLAPARARSCMADVSLWKMQMRKKIAAATRGPLTLTVGDQWGDMVVLREDDEIDELDEKYAANAMPYIVLRPDDGVSLWGLKLPAYD